MEIEIYQVDSFCKDIFSGNPAGVCPLDAWPENSIMQSIAAENNLPETAFYIKDGDHYQIRWFTPIVEVDLCGHATLAAAHVLFHHKGFEGNTILFISPRSGKLGVRKDDEDRLALDFPVDILTPIKVADDMYSWFSVQPVEAYKGKTDYMLIFQSESDIANISANLPIIEKLKEVRGVIVSAKGDSADFVSRFFAPQSGIPEDPVTGSAHTSLTPYWAKRLGKDELDALQLSARKGFLKCKNLVSRVEISGKAKTFMAGRIFLS
ncbi:MAG: PhzF family phenazine biosynthesis protein [Chitinophagaceae bacterium]